MKRYLALLLALLLLPLHASAEKVKKLPAAFDITYQVKERMMNNDRTFISKEHITTASPRVDEIINALVDDYDDQMSPHLHKEKTPRRNSRLDIHVVHSFSGQSMMSFLVLARETHKRVQLQSPFQCRTFDMTTGEEITLSHLFDEDSEGWDVMAEAVYEKLSAYFPHLPVDEGKLREMCTKDALQHTPFMLGPVCLSLHFEARALYPDQPSLMRVTIPYTAFPAMMTEYGERQTDNSMYRMVALTFDDGPTYSQTAALLNHLRHYSAPSTFFLVGDRIAEYKDIVLRENDENHSLQSHHFKHTDTTKSNPGRIQSYTKQFYQALSTLTGTTPIMLRPPYGLDEPFREAKVNLPIIQWDVDTKDWTGKTTAAVMSVVRNETRDGSIILMHDIQEKTPESAKQVAKWLKENGFICVTVEDLFLHFRQEMRPNAVYYSVKPNDQAI